MEESKPLDIFLQPSRRLMLFSLFFICVCAVLIFSIPLSFYYKSLLFFIMLVGIFWELKRTVLLLSARSIIRIGYDGGVMDSNGNVSEICWWYQRRSGEKVHAKLSSASRVWVEWVALDFSRWPWQFGRTVVVARDSVENPKDFQRLKRVLRS
jgi:hypothetical protein